MRSFLKKRIVSRRYIFVSYGNTFISSMSVIASVVQKGSYEIYVLELLLIFAEVPDLKFQIQLV